MRKTNLHILVLAGSLMASPIIFAESNPLSNANRIAAPLEKPVEKNLEKTRTYKGELAFTLQGRRFDDPVVNSRYSRLVIAANFEVLYREWFQANLDVLQLLTSGQASNLYLVSEGGTGGGTLVNEASVSLKPIKSVKATIGIIPLALNPVYSLLQAQSNAGGRVEAVMGSDSVFLTAHAAQSIPTSTGTSSRVVDDDTLPLMTTGSLIFNVISDASRTKFKVASTRFYFTDLSSQAASDSQKLGGTVLGNGKGGFLFAYDFRGFEHAMLVDQELFTKDKVQLKLSSIKNELAPEGINSGWQGRVEYTRAFRKFAIVPSYVVFRSESDSVPAVYGILSVGYTNRQGSGYGLKFDFPEERFSVFGGYTRSDVIDNRASSAVFQADREIYSLGAEAKYDIF